jgi:predicted lipoprotein with Yx(FWY)xxD motif
MTPRGTRLVIAVAAVAGAGVLALGAAGSTGKPTVKTAGNASIGTILVGATGLTLYHYADDHGTVVECNGACAKQWPPVLIAAGKKPVAGPGTTASKLGTVKRPDGTTQVTYAGLALYRFAGDTKGGQINGQGLQKEWYAIAPTGKIVKLLPAKESTNTGGTASDSSSSSSSSSSSGGSTDTGGGGGYGY